MGGGGPDIGALCNPLRDSFCLCKTGYRVDNLQLYAEFAWVSGGRDLLVIT